ncbi:MAG: serine dehydratase [Verrucomicrobia bacterium]|nr:MAG: serine dehydratase [Verrucomicrobiota bacterium]
MKPLHIQTPLWKSIPLQRRINKTIYLKMECFQPTGSFKARGISLLCQKLVASGKTHLVSNSGGNAGYTAAYAGRVLGVKVSVFIPTTSSSIFIDRIKSQGAEVVIHGNDIDEAAVLAKEFLQEVNGGYVPPYDNSDIWLGHSTMMDEVNFQIDGKPDAIVVAVGGGGLACGVLDWMYRWGWHDVPVYGVETEGAASFAATMKANKLVTLEKINTVATSLGVRTISSKLFEWTKKMPIYPITVSDAEAVNAVRLFLDDHYVLVEPSCGAALAAVYNPVPALADKKKIVVIICGGIGISFALLNQYLAQVSR